METCVVIMAGGIGSRFWPMSTPEYPKQFVDVLGVGKTLIQMTVERFLPMCGVENMWVVTNRQYVDIVKKQIPGIPAENILAEPAARNTAPCIAYASWKISKRHPDANIVVTPSDALVIDGGEYRRVVGEALRFAEGSRNIVTIGIKPTRPETGYGYVSCGAEVRGEIRKVAEFKEKPDLETARKYLEDGNYLWNAGIFVWKVETIMAALRQYSPQISGIMEEIGPHLYTEEEDTYVERLFPECEKISIDYAVMEKSPDIFTIPGDFGWSDLGSWGSLRQNSSKDERGNALIGENIRQYDCEGCVVFMDNMKQVVLEGLKDTIVAEKDGRLLVCRLASEQHIKEYSQE